MYRLDMTQEAILKQWDEDFKIVYGRAKTYFLSKAMRRIKKLPKNHAPMFLLHTVNLETSHNMYITACCVGNKTAFIKHHHVPIFTIGVVKDDEGHYNGIVVRGKNVFIYSPHFFRRYTERLGKKLPVTGKDWEIALGKYIAYNFEGGELIEAIHRETLTYERCCIEGVEMIRKNSKGVYIGVTFFSPQMLNNRQKSDMEDEKPFLQMFKQILFNYNNFKKASRILDKEMGRGYDLSIAPGIDIKVRK